MSNPEPENNNIQEDRQEDETDEELTEEQKQVAEHLNSLFSQRQKLFTQVERLRSTVHQKTFGTVFALQLQFERVSQAYDKFDTIQSEIESYEVKEDAEAFRSSFDHLYYETLGATMGLINQLNPPPVQQAASERRIHQPMIETESKPVLSNQIHVKLPPLQLPFFDGDFKQWLMFKDAFEANINSNTTLSNVQKFQYLRGQLKGEALQVIQNLETGEDSYTTAWKLLADSYEDHNHLVDLHLKAIFDISPITKATHTNLRHLVDTLNAHTRSLEKLQGPIDTWGNMILTHVIQSKLDFITKRDWDRAQEGNHQHSATYNEFIDFINKRSRTLMREEPDKVSKPVYKQKVEQSRKLSLTTTLGSCLMCKENHKIYTCPQFLKLNQEDRKRKILLLQLCLNCLGKGHFAQACKSSKCKKCGHGHNTLLHADTNPDTAVRDVNNQPETSDKSSLTSHGLTRNNSYVLLATALIFVKDGYGNFQKVRALLDPGSQSSYITESVSSKLKLNTQHTSERIAGIAASTIQINKETTAEIQSRVTSYSTSIHCLILPSISQRLPQTIVNVKKLKIPHDIQLADPEFHQPGEIQMLLGADVVWSLIIPEQIKLRRDQPVLQNTELGWLVSGPLPLDNQLTKQTFHSQTLQNQLQMFWQTEELPMLETKQADELCEQHFVETVNRDETGRFVVRLPLKPEVILGESYTMAMDRLLSLEKRFRNDPSLHIEYADFLQEYAELGHMTKVTQPMKSQSSYFMPHHPVIKKEALTTKLRVVFNASARTRSGFSLNDKLLVGPTIQADVFTILLRFRIHEYVMTADIEKMYRQIQVDERDQSFQQILWRSRESNVIEEFQLTTVTYGTACAPFLATRCLAQLANEDGREFPLAREVLIRDFYMDDVLTGCPTREEAVKLQQELVELLKRGRFSLRKWRFNDSQVADACKDPATTDPLHILQSPDAKTLGMRWDNIQDKFFFSIKTQEIGSFPITKRSILSFIARLFDPLGLLGPVIVSAKIILQMVWKCNLPWDEEVPLELAQTWKKFLQSLDTIDHCVIPRNVNSKNSCLYITLHVFSDASPQAYGACLYAVSCSSEGQVISRLICSKSKVAPNPPPTLPRLELNGAVLAVKLTERVCETLKDRILRVQAWTDSTIVLSWLSANSGQLKPYVAHRVQELQKHSYITWRHVPSEDNPADYLTRINSQKDLHNSTLWWHGPTWMSEPTDWPPQPSSLDIRPAEDEMKASLVTTTYVPEPVLFKFSSYNKLRRVIAYCLRWSPRFKSFRPIETETPDPNDDETHYRPLNCQELRAAETCIIKMIQRECFGDECFLLRNHRNIPDKSVLSKLNVYLDDEQVIRIQGRLQHAEIDLDYKHPIVLPKHHVSKLILRQTHERLNHCGTEQLIHECKQRFWTMFGRSYFKDISKLCLNCFRMKPKPYQQLMGQLPANRVNVCSRPFIHTGVDFAGPIQLKQRQGPGRQKYNKAYIALFICMATKAIHLELVTELSTEAFMASLTRFMARRGLCKTIQSDNATNFVGTDNILKELYQFLKTIKEELTQNLAERAVEWKFIPARSPHFGGIWEANIRSMKSHLNKVTKGLIMTYEECYTLLTSIESCLNSRPLTPLSSEPDTYQVLTPAHFLIGGPLLQPVERDWHDTPCNRLSRWQHLQSLKQMFWRKWSREYLHQLHTRAKWHKKYPNVEVGDLVLLIEDRTPALRWIVGRVDQLFPGKDKLVRVVSVRTSAGVFKRAISRLAPLPLK